jgi:hypothetical protein
MGRRLKMNPPRRREVERHDIHEWSMVREWLEKHEIEYE